MDKSNTKDRQAFLNGIWLGMSVDRAIKESRRMMEINADPDGCGAIQQAYNCAKRRLELLEAKYPDRGALS